MLLHYSEIAEKSTLPFLTISCVLLSFGVVFFSFALYQRQQEWSVPSPCSRRSLADPVCSSCSLLAWPLCCWRLHPMKDCCIAHGSICILTYHGSLPEPRSSIRSRRLEIAFAPKVRNQQSLPKPSICLVYACLMSMSFTMSM